MTNPPWFAGILSRRGGGCQVHNYPLIVKVNQFYTYTSYKTVSGWIAGAAGAKNYGVLDPRQRISTVFFEVVYVWKPRFSAASGGPIPYFPLIAALGNPYNFGSEGLIPYALFPGIILKPSSYPRHGHPPRGGGWGSIIWGNKGRNQGFGEIIWGNKGFGEIREGYGK